MSCVLIKHKLTTAVTASTRPKEDQASLSALKKAGHCQGLFHLPVPLTVGSDSVSRNRTPPEQPRRAKGQINIEIPSHSQSEEVIMSSPGLFTVRFTSFYYTVLVCVHLRSLRSPDVELSVFTWCLRNPGSGRLFSLALQAFAFKVLVLVFSSFGSLRVSESLPPTRLPDWDILLQRAGLAGFTGGSHEEILRTAS